MTNQQKPVILERKIMLRDNIRIHGNYTQEELEDLMDMIRPDCPSDDIDPTDEEFLIGYLTDEENN